MLTSAFPESSLNVTLPWIIGGSEYVTSLVVNNKIFISVIFLKLARMRRPFFGGNSYVVKTLLKYQGFIIKHN